MNVKVEGDKLIITIDISAKAKADAQPSKSGKTRLLASTNGFTNYGDVGLSLNATVK
jgi:hypothetical protein